MKYAFALLTIAFLLPFSAHADEMGMQTNDTLEPLPAKEWNPAAAAHLLRRAGFGGSLEDVHRLHAMGLDAAVESLLDWKGKPDPDVPAPRITVTTRPGREQYVAAGSEDARRKLRQEHRRRDLMQFAVMREWWLQVMLRTAHPLRERLTLFWHGHFTSSMRDVRNSYHMYKQNTLLRRHAAGNFRALLHGIAKDPAMLEYLDNRQNRKGHPNENFAREVMELFTLGAGNYSEADIKEAARALTGWTFGGNRFYFNRAQHDEGAKTILGRTANFDGEQFLDLLLEQPAASRYLAAKMFRYFAHEYPNDAVTAGLAQALVESDWELKPMLRTLLKSRAFFGPYARGTQIKSPVVLIVGLGRALDLDPELIVGGSVLASQLGQELMAPPNVKGWAGGRDWITTSILLERYNLCGTLVGAQADKTRGLSNRGRGQVYRARRMMENRMEPAGEQDMEMGGDMAGEQAGERGRRRGRRKPAPTYDVLKTVRLQKLTTPETILAHFCLTLYAMPASGELRATLGEYLVRDGGYPQNARAQRERLHGLLRLIVSTPEFQLN